MVHPFITITPVVLFFEIPSISRIDAFALFFLARILYNAFMTSYLEYIAFKLEQLLSHDHDVLPPPFVDSPEFVRCDPTIPTSQHLQVYPLAPRDPL